jgi:hypothetical protein
MNLWLYIVILPIGILLWIAVLLISFYVIGKMFKNGDGDKNQK